MKQTHPHTRHITWTAVLFVLRMRWRIWNVRGKERLKHQRKQPEMYSVPRRLQSHSLVPRESISGRWSNSAVWLQLEKEESVIRGGERHHEGMGREILRGLELLCRGSFSNLGQIFGRPYGRGKGHPSTQEKATELSEVWEPKESRGKERLEGKQFYRLTSRVVMWPSLVSLSRVRWWQAVSTARHLGQPEGYPTVHSCSNTVAGRKLD